MPHLHTQEGGVDITSSALLLDVSDLADPKVILHMHRKLGIWLQFGGHVEHQEHPWAALAHELEEETGYTLSQLKVMQLAAFQFSESMRDVVEHPAPFFVNTHPIPGDIEHFHSDLMYVLVTDQEPELEVAEDEVTEWRRFSRGELVADPQVHQSVRMYGARAIDLYLGRKAKGVVLIEADSYYVETPGWAPNYDLLGYDH